MTTRTKKGKAKEMRKKLPVPKVRTNATPVSRLQRLREDYGINHANFARMLGVSEETLAGWEKAGKAPVLPLWALKKVNKVEKLLAGLSRVMRKAFIPTWLETPNDASISAGGRTPVALMEKGNYEKIEAMIYFLESGAPF